MSIFDTISLNIQYVGAIRSAHKEIFKVVLQEEKYYLSSFKDELIEEIILDNESKEMQTQLKGLRANYALISKVNRGNLTAILDIVPLAAIKKIDKLTVFTERAAFDLPPTLNAGETDAIVVYQNINTESESNFYLNANNNKFYSLSLKEDFVGEKKEAKRYYVLGKEKKTIKDLKKYRSILIVGDISFETKKDYLSPIAQNTLKTLAIDVKNYLNLWDKYNRIELIAEYQEVMKIGLIKYDFIKLEQEIRVFFDDENFEKISKNQQFFQNIILMGNHRMLQLHESKDIEEYGKVEKSLFSNNDATLVAVSPRGMNITEKYVVINASELSFFQNIKHQNGGYLSLSLLGNETSSRRRQQAKEKIITGKAGMPQLHTLFSDDPEAGQKRERFEIDHQLISKKNLTQNQIEAISIICNTPDIAIIQGPPGTGKTTVIKEAVIQLNSKSKNKYNFGNNLLSGFRHETVTNMTDNIDLFGLPSIKIGDKSSGTKKDELNPRILQFIEKLTKEVTTKYADLTVEDQDYIEFLTIYRNYVNFNISLESTIQVLNEVKALPLFFTNITVQSQIDNLLKKIKNNIPTLSILSGSFLDVLSALPLNEIGAKDGLDDLLMTLEVFIDYAELKEDVIKVKNIYSAKEIDFSKARSVRRDLIIKYKKPSPIIASKADIEMVTVYLKGLLEIVRAERYKKYNGEKIAILEFVESLHENPYLLKETILKYTKVLGATNQQVLSKDMIGVKGKDFLFDNVIIDEAATSSPLDLFIPISLASERIVLVGDHRQLPNIVNEDILQKVLGGLEGNEKANRDLLIEELKSTFFEVIMEKAHKLEAIDGVKRVITLNSQFRMHPFLGEIVSRHFYLEDGGIKSPRPANQFEHNYHELTNKYLYWLDTPFSPNEKYRNPGSSSRKNESEARKICRHILEAFNSDGSNVNSVGIITIYKDQVNEIKRELHRVGIFDKDYVLTPFYAHHELLIGTVDAFQGREFDIVYLSLTYVVANVENEKNPYSRLAGETSSSLLCVALSRQRKMLIVVGSKELYSHSLCAKKVPSLYEIAALCSREGFYE